LPCVLPVSDKSSNPKSNSPQESPLRWAQPLILLSVVSVAMGQTLVFAILPAIGREVGLLEIQVGGIISASSVVFSLASAVWGNQSERWGRKRVMIIGLAGYTIGSLLFASMFWFGLEGWLTGGLLFVGLMISRMLQSSVMAATTPASTAYMADITDVDTRIAAMGKLGAAQNIGTIIGPALGGGLAIISLLLPLYFAAVATLVAGVLVWKFLPESPYQHKNKGPQVSPIELIVTAVKGYFDRRYVSFLVIGVSMFTAFAVAQQTLGFFYQDRMGLDAQQTAQTVGIAMMISAVCSLVAQAVLVQRFSFQPMTLVRIGLPIMAVGFLILATAEESIWLIACMGLVGFGMGMTMPGFTSAATLSEDASEQGAVAGVIAASPALGFILGPLVGTTLYQFDQTLPYWFTFSMFIPLILYVWWLNPTKPEQRL